MHIDKYILFNQIKNVLSKEKDTLHIDYNFLIKLIQQIIFHDATKDCDIK